MGGMEGMEGMEGRAGEGAGAVGGMEGMEGSTVSESQLAYKRAMVVLREARTIFNAAKAAALALSATKPRFRIIDAQEFEAWKAVTLARVALREAAAVAHRRRYEQDPPLWDLDRVRWALRRLAKKGIISWSGGKPEGLDPLVKLTPGPDVSDYVIEDRR